MYRNTNDIEESENKEELKERCVTRMMERYNYKLIEE